LKESIRALACAALAAAACTHPTPPPAADDASPDAAGATPASAATREANAAYAHLPLADPADLADAQRGLIAHEQGLVISTESGARVWDTTGYEFLAGDAPPTVNPSLWRQAKLNDLHGLFEVTSGVYQVRGYDISNMTIIEGKTGRIVVDPLTTHETAAAAWRLVEKTLGAKPVAAVIFTHSHIDHFGGIEGVISADEIAKRKVRVVAPARFLEEASSENVLAGVPMLRRAQFMYGLRLPRGPRGHVDTGLGKAPAVGSIGLAVPTDLVDKTPTELVLDGVRFVFQYTPESEAPAEMTFYLPEKKAFCSAEIVTHTMHNLYTLRGAKVRDALKWSGYIDDALVRFGDAEVMFASHSWPIWGQARIADYLAKQRDAYKYIHDQTLRLASSGATPREIAEQLDLPSSLAPSFGNRGYYGTVRHNAKAVYQWYFGWYDANPANLDPLPPAEAGARYVEAMGGASAVLAKAQASYDAGDYRWAATMLDHLVFTEPHNRDASELLARCYDQLGYRAESGPWRDVYLSGAYELRHGEPSGDSRTSGAAQLLRYTPIERFFDAMAARLDGPKADGVSLAVDFVFTDLGESYHLWIENAVLHHRTLEKGAKSHADVTVRLTKEFWLRLAMGQAGVRDLVFSKDLDVNGSRLDLLRFFSLLDPPDPNFAIVRP
jgi:alkyl sulfatase BDS1-like metallo-beta-lactamase superfamily hydrolase